MDTTREERSERSRRQIARYLWVWVASQVLAGFILAAVLGVRDGGPRHVAQATAHWAFFVSTVAAASTVVVAFRERATLSRPWLVIGCGPWLILIAEITWAALRPAFP